MTLKLYTTNMTCALQEQESRVFKSTVTHDDGGLWPQTSLMSMAALPNQVGKPCQGHV